MADIFTVIADPTRRELLRLLREDDSAESSVGELVAELGLSQPTVSKHLRVLREAGLVAVREEGQHRYYRLDAEPLEAVAEWVVPFVVADEVEDEAVADAVVEALGDGEGELVILPARLVPAPLRRAAETLPAAGDVGATLGRTVAGARSRLLDSAKKRLGHRD